VSTRIGVRLRTALGCALFVVLAAEVHADFFDFRGGRRPERKHPGFSVSAEFSGYLGGRSLLIEGVEYALSPSVTVYVLGEGLTAPGIMVSSASIYLAGDTRGGTPLVRSIIVRPGTRESLMSEGRSSDVGVRPESTPQ
jgi:hypothetical protein